MPTCVMLHASTPTPCFPYLPRSISRQGWIKWYKHRSSGLLRKWDSQWATKSLFFLALRPLAEAQPLKSKAGSKTRFKSRSATLAETWPESSRRVCPADTPAAPTTRTRQAVRVLADWRLVWLTAGIRSGPLDRDNLSFLSSKTSHCQFVPQVLSPPPPRRHPPGGLPWSHLLSGTLLWLFPVSVAKILKFQLRIFWF